MSLIEANGAIARLVQELSKLPGIGPKSAERITHFLLAGDRAVAGSLGEALRAVVEQVRPCKNCFNLTEGDLCPICANPKRDAGTICVVETPREWRRWNGQGIFGASITCLTAGLPRSTTLGPIS